MHPNLIHLPILPYLPCVLATCPQKKTKHLTMKLWCVTLCHTVYTLLPKQLLLKTNTSVSHWSCSRRPLTSPLRYPVVVLCHGDLEALALEDQPLHTLQQLIDDGDVGMGQLKALDVVA